MYQSSNFECETCDREFGSEYAASQHMNARGHWAKRYPCESCGDVFLNEYECEEHMDQYDHYAPKHGCEACSKMFYSAQAARAHMDKLDHWRRVWCDKCQRGFQNENKLRMHLNGAAHRANSIDCPFCKRNFTTATGVTHHLESGSCPNATNVNREVIYRAIRARDTSGVITHKTIEWHSQSNGSFEASNASWNGECFECYLCHRGFNTLRGLNQHLSSPAHKQRIYHCVSRRCGKEFTALAALFSHLESESCGAVRFERVQKSMQGILTGRTRAIAF
ncbi:hypothetical protein EJ05DRAFT_470949 [Pseudovirgaria hyperparasitica]|uniref:C2H2-type domain-containing protein n=1 Tax=Pseudovirgaria hyperparasitica TaxID=470096 RepID=A0A6A6VSY9_9PEZI|nr:uncharacterized protein EJ05DRAFT_470949 [Pseudovirgaria hyperparasitica]KAF2752874.1 hypothetical protein EJ05DRAFT_470949 [Pseudovirgaria hyperparasitica]